MILMATSMVTETEIKGGGAIFDAFCDINEDGECVTLSG